jgi:hypothetical protein
MVLSCFFVLVLFRTRKVKFCRQGMVGSMTMKASSRKHDNGSTMEDHTLAVVDNGSSHTIARARQKKTFNSSVVPLTQIY